MWGLGFAGLGSARLGCVLLGSAVVAYYYNTLQVFLNYLGNFSTKNLGNTMVKALENCRNSLHYQPTVSHFRFTIELRWVSVSKHNFLHSMEDLHKIYIKRRYINLLLPFIYSNDFMNYQ